MTAILIEKFMGGSSIHNTQVVFLFVQHHTIFVYISYHGKSRDAIRLSHEALAKLSPENMFERGMLLHVLGESYQSMAA